jgi:hypothetical protein
MLACLCLIHIRVLSVIQKFSTNGDIAIHDQFITRYLESGENRVIGRTRRLSGKKKDGTIFPIQVLVSVYICLQ